MPWAHSLNGAGQRHDSIAHLRGTAARARGFAEPFGAGDLAYYAGLWHDLGKFHPDWQAYLLASENNPSLRGHGPDHKGAGAIHSAGVLGLAGCLLVQGHHGGLRDQSFLKAWVLEKHNTSAVQEALNLAGAVVLQMDTPPSWAPPAFLEDPHKAEMFLRLAFSCLVDGDFLDTESHFNPGQSGARVIDVTPLDLLARFEEDQARLTGGNGDMVGQVRDEVYRACVQAASAEPGFFRLTVPTGGGKTRSGMAFALSHAARHGLDRVIVAIPFISITEQSADVYRQIFDRPDAPSPVLEHHSGRLIDEEAEDGDPGEAWQRLASENWDAPIVVTTTVQLFESLFARSTSACRKLHRLANSVIIIDEAQSLPASLLEPILDGLRFLVEHCGTTVVLSTATQPAFESIETFRGIRAREIVPQHAEHFERLKRVDFEWRVDEPTSWDGLADDMAAHPRALAILNTKKHALALVDALEARAPGVVHLSTLLCGAHRRRVLTEVRRRLLASEECRLVSTQVVEAGVDISFPLVYRALGPLDAIIQAAGRCNRAGEMERGNVVVFRPEDDGMPQGVYRTGTGVTRSLRHTAEFDPLTDATAREYFRQLFALVEPDANGIQEMRRRLDYPAVDGAFRMIDDDTEQVIVTQYGAQDERARVVERLEQLRRKWGSPRLILRELQPYMVSLRKREAERLRKQGFISEIMPGLGEWLGGYDGTRGLVVGDPEYVV